MLIDTHAHVNFNDFKDDYSKVIRRALKNNIWMINVGSQLSTSQRAMKLAQDHEKGVYAAIGLHPIHLSAKNFQDEIDDQEKVEFEPRAEEFKKEKYLELAKEKNVVAIGEVGLDYFHDQDNVELQKEVFSQQIDLAQELNLPVIVHCRQANEDVLSILGKKNKQYGEKLRGIIHCFSGNLEQAKQYNNLGFLLGFNGIITFAREYDEIIKHIALENMVVETDCPYLTPMPFRGKRNEPLYVEHVAQKIAEIRGISLEEVAETTTKSAKRLFDLN